MKLRTLPLLSLALSVFSAVLLHAAEIELPTGYTLQVLDVTKGEIARPKDWFYNHFLTEQGIVWTISKEDSSKGRYKTGFRIQFSPSVSKFTSKSPQELMAGAIATKQKSVKVDRICKQETVGEFQRICLETTEPSETFGKNYKILYTFSWSDEKNAVVVTTFGAPEEEWSALGDTIRIMSNIVLIGTDFWKK